MNAEHIENDKLQLFFDAELSESESSVVRLHVEQCDACGTQLRSMQELRHLFELNADHITSDLKSDELFASITKEIEKQERAGFGERFRVWANEFYEHRKVVWAPAAAALTVAAVALLWVAPWKSHHHRRHRDLELTGTEVVHVDFGQNTGTVFEVEGVAVVWIDDNVPSAEME